MEKSQIPDEEGIPLDTKFLSPVHSEPLPVGGYLRNIPIFTFGNDTVTSCEVIAALQLSENRAVMCPLEPKKLVDGDVQLTCISTGGNVAEITFLRDPPAPFGPSCICFSPGGWTTAPADSFLGDAAPFPPPSTIASVDVFSKRITAIRHICCAKLVKLARVVEDRLR
jgi:hypothetical protein